MRSFIFNDIAGSNLAGIYPFKVSNGNTRTMGGIFPDLIIREPECCY